MTKKKSDIQEIKEVIGMPEKFYASIIKVGGCYGLIIPKTLVEANAWKTGQKLTVWAKKVKQ